MDDSQSSDFMSNSIDYSCNSPENINQVSYNTLILRTKKSMNENLHCRTPESLSASFTNLLEDSCSCISQSLDLIIGLLVDSELHYRTLTEYMNNAVCLLQMLSDYIKTVVESVAMTCYSMKTLPVATGNIVMAVFTHCRDSETLYGRHLKHVEKQLKDLFRTCHELQLTYLTVLEKHFVFTLTKKEEQDVLIKALHINLTIGEIVQTLDVKTMAEQWKAYTMICEKHSIFLSGTNIFQDCTKVLSSMTMSNVTTAVEGHEDKIVLRSLKVASFAIKILLKLCGIFKCDSSREFTSVLEFLIFINMYNGPYLELELNKSSQFLNQITAIVFNPSNQLLAELACDEEFIQCCLQYKADTPKYEGEVLGFLVLVASVMEKMLEKHNLTVYKFKHKIIKCIFNALPKCHLWFNLGLRFKSQMLSSQRSYGLYEHVLIQSIALASTLSSEEYSALEEDMYEALMGTDFWRAIFASDLMVELSKNNRQLLIEQFVFLCKTCQKLENNKLFPDSPQSVHLSYTIARLFAVLKTEDQIRLFRRYDLGLWIPLQIKNIPPEIEEKFAEDIITELITKFDRMLASDIQSEDEMRQITKLMKAAATCKFIDEHELLANRVIKIWMKSCPKNRIVLNSGEMKKSYLWYLMHIEALVALTKSMKLILNDGALVKILHVMSNIAQLRNKDLNLVSIELLCEASLEISYENKNQLESFITQTYTSILQQNDYLTTDTLFKVLKTNTKHRNFEYVVSLLFSLDGSLQDTYGAALQDSDHIDMKNWRDNLISQDNHYVHKCLENTQVPMLIISGSSRESKENTQIHELIISESSKESKENSNNFDFADIDSLFGGESDSDQPACKKAKLNNDGRTEDIISRLETDSLLLSCEKENIFSNEQMSRIRIICDRLRNIID